TFTCNAVGNTPPTIWLWPEPAFALIEAGTAVKLLVSEKVAELAPVTEAVTVNDPVVPFAVSVGAIATPLALVFAVAVSPPLNVALAPLGLTVKVTVVPVPTGLPAESFTVACRAAKLVLIATVCGVPPVAVTDAGAPA